MGREKGTCLKTCMKLEESTQTEDLHAGISNWRWFWKRTGKSNGDGVSREPSDSDLECPKCTWTLTTSLSRILGQISNPGQKGVKSMAMNTIIEDGRFT